MNDDVVTQCVYCGVDLRAGEVTSDHVIPAARGGSNGVSNRAPACNACNRAKGPLTAREYLAVRDDPEDLAALIRLVETDLRTRTPVPVSPGAGSGRIATINARAERARNQGMHEAHAAVNKAAVAAAAARRQEAQERFLEHLEVAKVGWALEQQRRQAAATAAEQARAAARAEGRKAGT